MFSQILIVALLAAFAVAQSTEKPAGKTVAGCPSNLNKGRFLKTFGNTCYWFQRNYAMNHRRAVKSCQDSGGKLATIKSAEVNNFIQTSLKNDYQLDDAHMWIGLTFIPPTEKMVWSDGAAMGYSNFGNSKYFDGNCGVMATATGKWGLVSCKEEGVLFTETHGFVCEYASTTRTAPTEDTLDVLGR